MPTARSTPSSRICATASGMNGGECFIPRNGRNGVPSSLSRATRPSACTRVVSSKGNTLPIAS